MISTKKCPQCGESRKRAGMTKDGGMWTALIVFILFGGINVYCSSACRDAAYASNPHAKREKTLYFRFLWFLTAVSGIALFSFWGYLSDFGNKSFDMDVLNSAGTLKDVFYAAIVIFPVAIILWILRAISCLPKKAKPQGEDEGEEAIEKVKAKKGLLEKNSKLEQKDGLDNGILVSSICPICQKKTSRLYVCLTCNKSWCSHCNSDDIYCCPDCGSKKVLYTEWCATLDNDSIGMFQNEKCNPEFLERIKNYGKYKIK